MELTVHEFISLDGVVQGPGGADEDTSGGFDLGGWIAPFGADPAFGEVVDGWFAKVEEFLLGRSTFVMMRDYWSKVTDPDDPVAAKLNGLPKHVASRTLDDPGWQHATVLGDDLGAAVSALKARDGGELQVHGSCQLVHELHRLGLVDEYRLLVAPVVLGSGKRLFADALPTTFAVESRAFDSGLVSMVLRPTAAPVLGDFAVEDGEETTRLR